MIRFLARFSIIVLLYIIYGVYLANVDLKIVPEVGDHLDPEYYDYRGAINIRTDLSDGVGSITRVVESAQNAGLDFIVTTDLLTSQSSQPYNAYFERLLVTSGFDYRHLDIRLLILGINSIDTEQLNWKITDWLSEKYPYEREAFLIASAPFNKDESPAWGSSWPTGVDAIEVQNPAVIADRSFLGSWIRVLWSLLVYPFNTQYAFLRLYDDPSPELELWDRVGNSRPIVGLSGLDASARAMILPGSIIEFPSYQTSFELMSTHVLSKQEWVGSFEKDKGLLLNSMKKGHLYFSLDLLGNPKGFYAHAKVNDQTYLMGEKIKLKPNSKISYSLPHEPNDLFEVVLIRNGQRINHSNQAKGEFQVERSGVYRITVRVSPFLPLPDARKWITWLYTNPFYFVE